MHTGPYFESHHYVPERNPKQNKKARENMATASHTDVKIPYVRRNDDGALPDHAQMFSHIPEFMDMQPARVRNARATDQRFSIPTTGFQYARVKAPQDIDFMDVDQVKEKYFPVLEQLLKEQYVHQSH